jgi:hypothetical protein
LTTSRFRCESRIVITNRLSILISSASISVRYSEVDWPVP